MSRKLLIILTLLLIASMLTTLTVYAAPTDISLHQAGGGVGAPQIADGNTLGTKFTVAQGKLLLSLTYVNMPTYTSPDTVFTFKLFKWNTDYATTISGTPVFTETVENHPDNADRTFTFGTGLEAGTYVAYLCDGYVKEGGAAGAPAVWTSTLVDGVETYWNGDQRTDFAANIRISVDDAPNPETSDTFVIMPMIFMAACAVLFVRKKSYI